MSVLGGVRVQVPFRLLGDGEGVLAFIFGGHDGCGYGDGLSGCLVCLVDGRVRVKFAIIIG